MLKRGQHHYRNASEVLDLRAHSLPNCLFQLLALIPSIKILSKSLRRRTFLCGRSVLLQQGSRSIPRYHRQCLHTPTNLCLSFSPQSPRLCIAIVIQGRLKSHCNFLCKLTQPELWHYCDEKILLIVILG